jgi:predicted SAM-dependent methyltransferase
MKLDIGAGNTRRDNDFKTVDFYTEADIKAQMWEIPVEDNSVDEIWSSHALEHVPIVKVHPTLLEWFRILKPGGRAEIQVPNFDYIAKYWLTGSDRAWAEMIVFGNQAHEGEYHKSAFTTAGLRADLEAAGFIIKRIEITIDYNQETIKAIVTKPDANTAT